MLERIMLHWSVNQGRITPVEGGSMFIFQSGKLYIFLHCKILLLFYDILVIVSNQEYERKIMEAIELRMDVEIIGED